MIETSPPTEAEQRMDFEICNTKMAKLSENNKYANASRKLALLKL